MEHNKSDICTVSFYGESSPFKKYVIKSLPLKNGISTFSISNIVSEYRSNVHKCPDGAISIAISSQGNKYFYCYPLLKNGLITVYTHDEYLFLKLIEGDKVKSTISLFEADLFSICFCSLLPQNNSYYCSFCIHNHAH